MAETERQAPPERRHEYEALAVFLGEWNAEGWSYGGPDQDPDAPRANREAWRSTHTGRWHTGGFFLVQDERARLGAKGDTPFDTLSVTGWDQDTGYFARSFENHGFQRRYDVVRDGAKWTLSGATERATIRFSDDARTQTIVWEWLRDGTWLPLCDRTAVRCD